MDDNAVVRFSLGIRCKAHSPSQPITSGNVALSVVFEMYGMKLYILTLSPRNHTVKAAEKRRIRPMPRSAVSDSQRMSFRIKPADKAVILRATQLAGAAGITDFVLRTVLDASRE
ncbi:MAG: DUF1778 domain-containing protein, partial [Mesorhizobium sp.]